MRVVKLLQVCNEKQDEENCRLRLQIRDTDKLARHVEERLQTFKN